MTSEMGSSTPWAGGRVWRTALLIVAWVLLVASLAAPALNETLAVTLMLPLGSTPVWLVLIVGATALLRRTPLPYALVLPGPALFVFTPWLPRSRAIVWRLIPAVLLSAWAFPLWCGVVLSAQQRRSWGCDEIRWGYYVFAIAQTIAFIGLELGIDRRPRPDRRHGFPVVVPKAPSGSDSR